MSVHYKFKSTLDFDTITFDGLYISVGDLKKEILQQKRLGKLTDFDLQVTNAQTKEEYNEESCLIPKNTSLIIARIPLTQPKKTWNIAEVEKPAPNRAVSRADGSSLDLSKMEGSEEDKINAMMMQSTAEYDPKSYQRLKGHSQTGEVPPSYRCNRCKRTGHWIKNCTFNGNKEHMEMKRNTGIPRSFLEKNENMQNETPAPPVEMEKQEIPEDLICVICNDIFTDAVMIPCCGSSFCDDCVRTALLESEENECPDCKEKDCSPESLIPNRFLRNSVNVFKNETGYKAAPVKKVVRKLEVAPKAASPQQTGETEKQIPPENKEINEESSKLNKEQENEPEQEKPKEKEKDASEKENVDKDAENNSDAPNTVVAKVNSTPQASKESGEMAGVEAKAAGSPNFEEAESDYEDNITVTVPTAQTEAQRAAFRERPFNEPNSRSLKPPGIDSSPRNHVSQNPPYHGHGREGERRSPLLSHPPYHHWDERGGNDRHERGEHERGGGGERDQRGRDNKGGFDKQGGGMYNHNNHMGMPPGGQPPHMQYCPPYGMEMPDHNMRGPMGSYDMYPEPGHRMGMYGGPMGPQHPPMGVGLPPPPQQMHGMGSFNNMYNPIPPRPTMGFNRFPQMMRPNYRNARFDFMPMRGPMGDPRHMMPPNNNLASVYHGVAAKVGPGIIDDPLEVFNRIMKEKEKRKEERRRSPDRRRSRSNERQMRGPRFRSPMYDRNNPRNVRDGNRGDMRDKRGRSRDRDVRRDRFRDRSDHDWEKAPYRHRRSNSFSDRGSRSRSRSHSMPKMSRSPNHQHRRSRSRPRNFGDKPRQDDRDRSNGRSDPKHADMQPRFPSRERSSSRPQDDWDMQGMQDPNVFRENSPPRDENVFNQPLTPTRKRESSVENRHEMDEPPPPGFEGLPPVHLPEWNMPNEQRQYPPSPSYGKEPQPLVAGPNDREMNREWEREREREREKPWERDGPNKERVKDAPVRERERDRGERVKERDSDKDRQRERERDKEREREKDKNREKEEKERTREKDRDKARDVDREKEKQRERDRNKERPRDRDREKEREVEREREKNKEKEKLRDREKEKEKEREKEKDKEKERERERERIRDKERERIKVVDRERERERDREREREREREKEKERDMEREKERDREREREIREKHTERGRDRDRERERDKNRRSMSHDKIVVSLKPQERDRYAHRGHERGEGREHGVSGGSKDRMHDKNKSNENESAHKAAQLRKVNPFAPRESEVVRPPSDDEKHGKDRKKRKKDKNERRKSRKLKKEKRSRSKHRDNANDNDGSGNENNGDEEPEHNEEGEERREDVAEERNNLSSLKNSDLNLKITFNVNNREEDVIKCETDEERHVSKADTSSTILSSVAALMPEATQNPQEQQILDLYADICEEEGELLEDEKKSKLVGQQDTAVLEQTSIDLNESKTLKHFDSVLDIHDYEMDFDDLQNPLRAKTVNAMPEISKWEREDQQPSATTLETKVKSSENGKDKVTNEILRKAENAIFTRAINAIRPSELMHNNVEKSGSQRRGTSADKHAAAGAISTNSKNSNDSTTAKDMLRSASIKSFQITVPVSSQERSVEIRSSGTSSSASGDKKKSNSPRQVRASVKERLGRKVDGNKSFSPTTNRDFASRSKRSRSLERAAHNDKKRRVEETSQRHSSSGGRGFRGNNNSNNNNNNGNNNINNSYSGSNRRLSTDANDSKNNRNSLDYSLDRNNKDKDKRERGRDRERDRDYSTERYKSRDTKKSTNERLDVNNAREKPRDSKMGNNNETRNKSTVNDNHERKDVSNDDNGGNANADDDDNDDDDDASDSDDSKRKRNKRSKSNRKDKKRAKNSSSDESINNNDHGDDGDDDSGGGGGGDGKRGKHVKGKKRNKSERKKKKNKK